MINVDQNSSLTDEYDMLKEYEISTLKSKQLMELFRKINLISSFVVILIGFIGNCLITLVFIQKKFRSNSSHVYLLCLSVIDNLFLIIHLFEDTLKTYKVSLKRTSIQLIIN